MLTDIHDFYHAFMEGLMGRSKAWKFMRKAEIWRFADAQRLGRMYRLELERLKAENARLAGKVAVSDYFGPLGEELRQVCRDLDEIARQNHLLKSENARMREALGALVDRVNREDLPEVANARKALGLEVKP